jgi:hypothetical protein
VAAHQLTLCQKYEDIEGLILLWGSSLPMQLNLSFIVLLTSRQSPPSNSPALVSHLLPFIIIGRPPYSKEGQCLANSPTGISVGELPSHGHLVRTWNVVNNASRAMLYRYGRWENYTGGAFRVSGNWDNNVQNSNNVPQGGRGDQAGTTEGTGDNAYHNNVSPAIAVYIWKRVS